MARYRNFIRNWRTYRGLKQREVIDRLEAIRERDGGREKFPATEASLSRVEAGDQNFNMALLTALAEVLEAAHPADLLTVNPFKGTLSLIRATEGLSDVQIDAAIQVVRAMRFGSDESQRLDDDH